MNANYAKAGAFIDINQLSQVKISNSHFEGK